MHLDFEANDTREFEETLIDLVKNYPEKSIIRLTVSGSIKVSDYK